MLIQYAGSVRLRREGGAFRQPYGLGHTATGDLHLTYRTASGRRVPLLQLLGTERQWPALYEPKLVSMLGTNFSFLGFERDDRAWVMQQWDCELL
jgi:hypothetical protein